MATKWRSSSKLTKRLNVTFWCRVTQTKRTKNALKKRLTVSNVKERKSTPKVYPVVSVMALANLTSKVTRVSLSLSERRLKCTVLSSSVLCTRSIHPRTRSSNRTKFTLITHAMSVESNRFRAFVTRALRLKTTIYARNVKLKESTLTTLCLRSEKFTRASTRSCVSTKTMLLRMLSLSSRCKNLYRLLSSQA